MNNQDSKQGLLFALAAYGIWGFVPIFFKSLETIEPVGVLCYRIIYSFLILIAFSLSKTEVDKIKSTMKDLYKMKMLFITSILLGVHWLMFIWAITNDHILDTSLGYLINPLLNVLFGVVIFKERFARLQIVAIFIAVLAVILELIKYGTLPLLSIFIALTFTLYAFVRKQIPVGTKVGLLIENGLMLIPSIIYVLCFTKDSDFVTNLNWQMNILLFLSGFFSTVPYLFWIGAAKKLRFSILGLTQYLEPTISMLVAIFIYKEQMQNPTTFILIWIGAIIFVLGGFKFSKKV